MRCAELYPSFIRHRLSTSFVLGSLLCLLTALLKTFQKAHKWLSWPYECEIIISRKLITEITDAQMPLVSSQIATNLITPMITDNSIVDVAAQIAC